MRAEHRPSLLKVAPDANPEVGCDSIPIECVSIAPCIILVFRCQYGYETNVNPRTGMATVERSADFGRIFLKLSHE